MSGRKTGCSGDFGGLLYRKLQAYGTSDYYAFHMPGHKRRMGVFENPYLFDITEIDGFDDLHHPEQDGVLTRAQERAAELFGAEETHFLVGGSTAGILSAVSGCVRRGGRFLMARNSHRSVYHVAELRNLRAEYLYPERISRPVVSGAIRPEDVERALEADQRRSAADRIQAVLIPSPTYDGICSDIGGIAGICHHHGIPLLVDQAHGAHFPFSDYFPEDALHAGADVVIQSVHKTLPALTQTALLHIQGRLADRERIRRFLSVYQSSSPSYVLMASIDACVDLLEREKEALFGAFTERLAAFRESCADLQELCLADRELLREEAEERVFDFDRSKILVLARRPGAAAGGRLAQLLSERYHIQPEMAGTDYITCIASLADTEEGFRRLGRALHQLDGELSAARGGLKETAARGRREEAAACGGRERTAESGILPELPVQMTAGEARDRASEAVPLAESVGRTAAEYVYLYPPGIPFIVPGEVMTAEAAERTAEWLRTGFAVHGLTKDRELPVIRE